MTSLFIATPCYGGQVNVFFMESIMYMAHGIRVYINVILEGFCSKSKVESKVNAHLVRLVPNNLPKSRKENQTKNIFNWFK